VVARREFFDAMHPGIASARVTAAARRAEKETVGIWLSAVLEPPPLGLAGAKTLNHGNTIMSQHRSLRVGGATAAKRNVLKRFERVEVLKKRGQWKDGDRVTGLRKTKPE
jgi:small basic protein (TIGR04137 family)